MAIVVIIKEANKRHEVTLSEESFVIGRSRKSDLKINDAEMSGTHCSLKLSGGRAFVTDLESTNGTCVNNKKINQSPLYIDDIIKIGHTTIYLFKKKMTPEEQALHTSSSRDAVNQRLAQADSTSSKIQKMKEQRRARAAGGGGGSPVPESMKVSKGIGGKNKKKSDGFAVLTRILKIK